MGKNCFRHCWLDYAHWLPGCSCKKDHRGICSPVFRRCFKIALPSYFVHSLLYFWEQLLCLSSQSPCLLSTPLSGTYEDRIRKWEESTFPETTISEIGIACLHGRLRQWESILTSTWMSLGKKATGSHSTFLQVFLSRAWPASWRSCCLHPSSPCSGPQLGLFAEPNSIRHHRLFSTRTDWAVVGILGWANSDAPSSHRFWKRQLR